MTLFKRLSHFKWAICHTKFKVICITFILKILFQYRLVPRTRPHKRCTRLYVPCLIIIVQEQTWIHVKTRNNWSSMSTLISNVRFRAKFPSIFRLWNADFAIFKLSDFILSKTESCCWAAFERKSVERKGMKCSRYKIGLFYIQDLIYSFIYH